MAWEVEYTDEFGEWWDALDPRARRSIEFAIRLLEAEGPRLGYPHTSGIIGARHRNMRELRIQHGGDPYRVFYAFDPRRTAILLIAGSKKGIDGRRFYGEMIVRADALYDVHLQTLEREGLI